EATDNAEDKYSLYAKYFAFKITGAANDRQDNFAELLDKWIAPSKTDQIMKSFLKIKDTIQIYIPVRTYS
ncbi:unnamed protein product, partial [Rotaria sp. Silwood2]